MGDLAPPASDLFTRNLAHPGVTVDPFGGQASALSPWGVLPSVIQTDMYLFGDGSDGDLTISGATSLSRDMYYKNLTVGATGVLSPNGYRIYVLNTLTVLAGGKIQADANQNLGGGNRSGATSIGLGPGSNGATPGPSAPSNGSPGLAATSLAGASGKGGDANDGVHVGGAAAQPVQTGASPRFLQALLGYSPTGLYYGGCGGGSGAVGTGQTNVVNAYGGGGGGFITIAAAAIVNGGSISAIGGTAPAVIGADPGVKIGGGGGGGGGCIMLAFRSLTEGTTSVAGGSGAAGVNGGATGDTGSAGSIFRFQVR